MTDWLPQIVKIENIRKHPDADALDIATVLGDYPVIVKRDEYKIGDLAGYLPIDTIVPDTDQFYFLCPKAYEKYEENGEIKQRQLGPKYTIGTVPEKYRIIKAKRIRGTYSQGMLVKIPLFVGFIKSNSSDSVLKYFGNPDALDILESLKVGDSIVDLIGLKKWEEEEEDNIVNAKRPKGTNAEIPPKGWAIPHYDINSVRKYVDCLHLNEEILLTEKLHGCNSAFVYDGTRLWVKSRNYYKKMDECDQWWDIAIRYNLEEKLSKFPMMAFFGEIYGIIKGFRYDCELVGNQMHSKIRFFDIFDIKKRQYLDYDHFVSIIKETGLDLMPELYRGPWLEKSVMYQYAEGMTLLGGKHIREGFVLRTVKERYEPKLDSRMQVKLVGEGYNLQK